MCGIFLTRNYNRISVLRDANADRGNFEYTCTKLQIDGSNVYIGHLLSPTGTKETVNLHPSVIDDTMLWHNGVITQPAVEKLGGKSTDWDTAWLHRAIVDGGFDALDDIDGAFACLYYDGVDLYVFRNPASPLFHGKGGFSSNRVDDIEFEVTPGIVYKVMPDRLVFVQLFNNKSSPYYFGDFE